MARRHEGEGYAEGKAWKQAGMAAWTLGVQAMRATGDAGGAGEQGGGWTRSPQPSRHMVEDAAAGGEPAIHAALRG